MLSNTSTHEKTILNRYATVPVNEQERRNGRLEPETLRLATNFVLHNGYVILEEALPQDFIEEIYQKVVQVYEEFSRKEDHNRGTNRYRIRLSLDGCLADEAITTNPLATQILDELLGKDFFCNYFATDVALPGSKYQNIHSDAPQEPPTFSPRRLIVNMPLVDFTDENGPLEIWPGATHLLPGVLPADVEKFGEKLVFHRLHARRGSILIRDVRTWHRGTPNLSDAARPNLAMVFQKSSVDSNYFPLGVTESQFRSLSPAQQHVFRHEVRFWSSMTRLTSAAKRQARSTKQQIKKIPMADRVWSKIRRNKTPRVAYVAAQDVEKVYDD